MKKLITTGYFGIGIGILLFNSNQNLPKNSYIAHIPFYMFISGPLASLWH